MPTYIPGRLLPHLEEPWNQGCGSEFGHMTPKKPRRKLSSPARVLARTSLADRSGLADRPGPILEPGRGFPG